MKIPRQPPGENGKVAPYESPDGDIQPFREHDFEPQFFRDGAEVLMGFSYDSMSDGTVKGRFREFQPPKLYGSDKIDIRDIMYAS